MISQDRTNRQQQWKITMAAETRTDRSTDRLPRGEPTIRDRFAHEDGGGAAEREPSRRCLLGAIGGIAAVTVASTVGQARAETASAMTPEVRLIEAYNQWFINEGAFLGPPDRMRAGLPRYITDETVLHEPESLPWGGTMVGYDGWERLCRISGPVWKKILPFAETHSPKYYQNGSSVLHEITIVIKQTPGTPGPFSMGLVEKYMIKDEKIVQIDEFFSDTASFLKRLMAMGILPKAAP